MYQWNLLIPQEDLSLITWQCFSMNFTYQISLISSLRPLGISLKYPRVSGRSKILKLEFGEFIKNIKIFLNTWSNKIINHCETTLINQMTKDFKNKYRSVGQRNSHIYYQNAIFQENCILLTERSNIHSLVPAYF